MSIRAIQAVWDRTATGGSVRLLLLALADFADEEGWAWPSVATLAHRTGRSERQVQRLIGIAIEAGELESDRGGGRGSSRYRITPGGEPVGGVTSTSPLGRHRRQGRGDTRDTPGATPATPEPSREPSDDPSPAGGRGETTLRRYQELTGYTPQARARDWLVGAATELGDEHLAWALEEAHGQTATREGWISKAIAIARQNPRPHPSAAAASDGKPAQTDEERERILETNRQRARASRAQLLADGRLNPTRPGDEDLLREEIERRKAAAGAAR